LAGRVHGLAGLAVALLVVGGTAAPAGAAGDPCGPGIFVRAPSSEPVTAAFGARSYGAGDVASLRVSVRAPTRGSLRIYHAGPGRRLRRLATFAALERPARRVRLRASVRHINVRIGG
jgi:hypothetical protein